MKNKPASSQSVHVDAKELLLLRERNPKFLESLFLDINPYLLRVCAGSGIYQENADEVVHQTWEKFFLNLDKFEGRSQIRTFVCGILFNKIHEHRRLLKKTVYTDDSEQALSRAFTPDGWWTQDPPDPHKLVELRQAGDFIKDCLEGLSDQQRAAFVMKEAEEQESEEICNILMVNITHLRVLLFRAKEKLRLCLEGKESLEKI